MFYKENGLIKLYFIRLNWEHRLLNLSLVMWLLLFLSKWYGCIIIKPILVCVHWPEYYNLSKCLLLKHSVENIEYVVYLQDKLKDNKRVLSEVLNHRTDNTMAKRNKMKRYSRMVISSCSSRGICCVTVKQHTHYLI